MYIISPALTYAMGTNDKKKTAITEMRMLRGIRGVTSLEHTPSEDISRVLSIPPTDEVLCSGRLRWLGLVHGHVHGHVHRQRREDNAARGVTNLALPGVRRRGRPRKTWIQPTREDLR